jgi:putative ABC transport system permease protein
MGSTKSPRARTLMAPYALFYLYRARLRVHVAQELLAGLGVTIAVALAFATTVANSSIAASANQVDHAVIGPANLQLRALSSEGFDEGLLGRAEHLPGVIQAAPLLEQTATILGPGGNRVTVNVAGTNLSLATLDGLAHTLPISTFSPGGIGLSNATADALGISSSNAQTQQVLLELRGHTYPLKVAAVLGEEAFGALSNARVAVMTLAHLQQLAGLSNRIGRILVRTRHGSEAAVRADLYRLGAGRVIVSNANQDISLLHEALRPSDQASGFFAAISALLGFLFAFNAMLFTVPDRRKAIADLRLVGTRRSAIVQMILFQALSLGIVASALGLMVGYLLSLGTFHQSSGYLAEAFTLGTNSVIGVGPMLLSLAGGTLATCLASIVPLFDLRRGRALDAVYFEEGEPGNALGRRVQRRFMAASAGLLVLTTVAFILESSLALITSAVLALATVFAVPVIFKGILSTALVITENRQKSTIFPVALTSLKATTLRSLALAATGSVALFGSVALGGARNDLLRGIKGFAQSYSADADIWVTNPNDNQATVSFPGDQYARRIARVPGVAAIKTFQGDFLQLGNRRTWVIARPAGANQSVLRSQALDGSATVALKHLGERGWIAVSRQIAEEHHLSVGGTLSLPTPTGIAQFRIAATTTNLAWSPGVIFLNTQDYSHLWATTAPTALGIKLDPGTDVARERSLIQTKLGPTSGLEVSTAGALKTRINKLTNEGLGRLGEISTLLLLAAILAMGAALTSAIWQRRVSLAGLRLSGARPSRLWKILLTEVTLILSAGCVTGTLTGIYGQVVIDDYLKHITGFPVAAITTSWRPLLVLALVTCAVILIVVIPGWLAARVSPALALEE